MMPIPRKQQISLNDTPYYHCISRCVRRAFLCGKDPYTGKSYEHRRSWVEKRVLLLSTVFAIEICAYAIMSNHTHIVLRVDQDKVNQWDTMQIINQWHQLYSGTLLTQKYLSSQTLSEAEYESVIKTAEIYKQRLIDVSWFMRSLNEPIARRANKEDECTGRFWEGRFKSVALLSDTALLACMAYVDLNPIRAKIANKIENSNYTSIKIRLNSYLKQTKPKKLIPFNDSKNYLNKSSHLPISTIDYINLIKHTANVIQSNKTTRPDKASNKVLLKLGLPKNSWFKLTAEIELLFSRAIGNTEQLANFCSNIGLKRRQGYKHCNKYFNTA